MDQIILFIICLLAVFFNAYWVGHDVATNTIAPDTLMSALAAIVMVICAVRVMQDY